MKSAKCKTPNGFQLQSSDIFVEIMAHLDPAPELNVNEKTNPMPAYKKCKVRRKKLKIN